MNNNDNNNKKGSGAGAALLVGMAVGAAGMYLKDKKNQEKVAKKFNDIKTWSNKNMKDVQEKAEETGEQVVQLKKEAGKKLKEQGEILEEETEKQMPRKAMN